MSSPTSPSPTGSVITDEDLRVTLATGSTAALGYKPWPALWAMVLGFFMILIDTTIVTIANPSIMRGLKIDSFSSVIWATSAYLLAYAVPLLITGRLGDRFGPKRIYLIGLVIFTLSSLWCGLSGSLEMLILARVLQGIGAAFMTPQTMSVITRIFPPDQRGSAMAIWGATAGVATLVGPILGGVLVDSLGWEWIFIVNVPIGVVAFIAAWRLVPNLQTHKHRFDWIGVALSAVGMFLLVFGIQEANTFKWGTIAGPITVWGCIIVGVVVLVAFVLWQRFNRSEPLLPLKLFRDRNFSISNIAITFVGVGITAMPLPLAFYYQLDRGLQPTQAALMLAPMSIVMGGLAPVVGRMLAGRDARWFAIPGFAITAFAIWLYSVMITPDVNIWLLLIPSTILGLGMVGIWGPLGTTVTRNLPPNQAGAGSGVFNMSRQVGSVLGSALIAAFLTLNIAAQLTPLLPAGTDVSKISDQAHSGEALPAQYAAGFATAMSQSLWMPIIVFLAGTLIVIFFAKPKPVEGWKPSGTEASIGH